MQNTAKSIVSIIIPTYNRAHLIGETLDSVIAQTYEDWECIVVDDGSNDNTEELINFYLLRDSRIKFYHRPKNSVKGANACRNLGANLSAGEFLMWLDDDDLLHRDKIKHQLNIAIQHPNSIITCAWGRLHGKMSFSLKELSIYKDYKDPISLLVDYGNHEFLPAHCFLVPKVVYQKAGTWLESLSINQDGEFFCRAILASKSVKFAKGTFVMYRADNVGKTSGLSSIEKARDLIESWKLIERLLTDHRRKDVSKYIYNGKSYAYILLKEKRYRILILKNALFFKSFIQKDILRKLKTIFK